MDYHIDIYRLGDERGIVELLQLVFNGWPKFDLSCTPLEHWEWKHLDNPLSTRMIVKAVGEGDDRIIGCHHCVDLNVKIGDQVYHFNNDVDLAVHPDYRRMGIWKNMNEFLWKMKVGEGLKMNFWSTSNPAVMKATLTPDLFEFPEEISHFVIIRNLDLHFKIDPSDNAWIKKIGYCILNSVYKIRNFFRTQFSSGEKLKIVEISKFDSRINEFWEAVSEDYSFIVERRQDYLNWRYCDPRGGKYHIYVAEENDSIIGYSVAKINKYNPEYHRGQIVDLLALSDRFDVSEALIRSAVEFFDNSDVNLIDCIAVRNSPLAEVLRKCGFLDSRQKLFVASSPRDMTEEEIKNVSSNISMKKAHFVYGDID